MKRALTAAVFGGLIMLFGPQVATADHNAERSGDCAGRPQGSQYDSERSAPGGGRYYDHEKRDDQDGEFLF